MDAGLPHGFRLGDYEVRPLEGGRSRNAVIVWPLKYRPTMSCRIALRGQRDSERATCGCRPSRCRQH